MEEAFNDPSPHLTGLFAAVAGMDTEVNRVIASLDEQHIRLVIFTSDNGFNAGHHGIWGKGNGTFPLNMYDTSVKVPLILNQPGRIAAGVTDHQLVSGYDLRTTVLAALAVDDPTYKGPGMPLLGTSQPTSCASDTRPRSTAPIDCTVAGALPAPRAAPRTRRHESDVAAHRVTSRCPQTGPIHVR